MIPVFCLHKHRPRLVGWQPEVNGDYRNHLKPGLLATSWRFGPGRRIVLSYADQNIFCDRAVSAGGAPVRRRQSHGDIDDEGSRQLHDQGGLQRELVGAWKHPRSPRHADVTVQRSGDLERGPYRNRAVQLVCRPGLLHLSHVRRFDHSERRRQCPRGRQRFRSVVLSCVCRRERLRPGELAVPGIGPGLCDEHELLGSGPRRQCRG